MKASFPIILLLLSVFPGYAGDKKNRDKPLVLKKKNIKNKVHLFGVVSNVPDKYELNFYLRSNFRDMTIKVPTKRTDNGFRVIHAFHSPNRYKIIRIELINEKPCKVAYKYELKEKFNIPIHSEKGKSSYLGKISLKMPSFAYEHPEKDTSFSARYEMHVHDDIKGTVDFFNSLNFQIDTTRVIKSLIYDRGAFSGTVEYSSYEINCNYNQDPFNPMNKPPMHKF